MIQSSTKEGVTGFTSYTLQGSKIPEPLSRRYRDFDIYEDKKYNFNHKCSTEGGSSGSPILNLKNKLIGIHKETDNNNKNKGTFLNFPIKEFIKIYYNEYKNNKNI